jgi:exonuclease SbcD
LRIIHTADWHLCHRLGRVDRSQDLRDRVERIAGLCETHAADVLLIAGDLFSEGAHVTLDMMNDALDHLFRSFASFFGRGGTILAITGNHDREVRIESVRHGMRFAAPEGGLRLRPGRMYLQNRPFLGALETNGEKVQFALVPYPTTVRYGLPDGGFQSKPEENQALNAAVASRLGEMKAELDPKVPAVLAGHLHVASAGMSHTLFHITEADDVVFDTGPLLGPWQYIALGHVHMAQALPGLPHVRYAGCLDRMNMDEADYETGVVLVDIGSNGIQGEPKVLPLEPTPMHKLAITDPAAELPSLAERIDHPETALVHVTATYVPGGPSRDEIIRAIRAAFPRYTEIEWAPLGHTDAGQAERIKPGADYRDTVRKYLDRELKQKNDSDTDELLKLAETFLAAEATR